MRLDRFLIRRGLHSGKDVARLLADGRVTLGETVETNGLRKIDRFSRIVWGGKMVR